MFDKRTKNLVVDKETIELGYFSLKFQKWVNRLWKTPSVYTVFVTQTSTNNPVVTVLNDTITGITATRSDVGTYLFTSNGKFIEGKTTPNKDAYTDIDGNYITAEWVDINTITLKTYAAIDTEVLADGVLENQYFNIETYNN